MTITGLTRDDSGIYTAEINGKETSKTKLLVISPVPKPTISVSCEPEMTYCVFTCSGSITGAEPVTYWWTADEKRWNSTNQHKITKVDKELWFSCELENPVSSISSEKVFNPFIEKPLYKKIGDKAVLTPDSVENPITSITWKHGDNIAMVWYGDKPSSYQQFKDRGSLDISTGVMTITGLTRDDSGIYTAEINIKVNSKTQLMVISPVPKPSISVSCKKTYCVYTCDGSTTDAEPVTYWWTADEKRWPSTKELKITKEDKEQWFSCELENPVSSSSSEKVINLFKKELLYGKLGDKAVLTPDSVENPIYRIVWKHGPNIAMQWWHEETSSYRQFKDRGSLDISTGVMTITGLTRDDSGIYTAEINNRVPSKTLLLVISPVPKPSLYISCDPEMTYCVLTCSGSTTDAEPVTYWWTAGKKRWTSTNQLKITKEEKKMWFRCELENPVSSNSSEKVFNPFIEKPLYKKIGDNVVLRPDSVVNPIISIRWKHGPDIAMEWYRYGGTIFSYQQFKDRGSLDISTGVMTITGLTRDDSGIYTVEINNEVNSQTELLVISPVPKPTISVSCDTEKTYCDFTCSGSITGAEPVTYRWTTDDKRWTSTNQHKITKEDKEEWFICTLKNPVSSNSSEKVFNPFIEREGDRTWIYILVPVVAGIVVICIIIACFIYKCKKGKTDGYTFTGLYDIVNQFYKHIGAPAGLYGYTRWSLMRSPVEGRAGELQL
ncbi:titin-like [Scomber scombrus]|uniref:titin-like n=1 Tax=Scomber scombrus TaxID=13677 RepID=UPI002DDB02AE|nr:titin-like [Scomber scombrus]